MPDPTSDTLDRIHARIAAAFSRRPVLPHLMAEPDPASAAGGLASRAGQGRNPSARASAGSPPPAQGRGWTRDELRALQLAAATAGVVGDLARKWLQQGLLPLEQEALDPASPVAAEISPAQFQTSLP